MLLGTLHTTTVLLVFHKPSETAAFVTPIVQMRKLRNWEVQQFVQGHWARKWWSL